MAQASQRNSPLALIRRVLMPELTQEINSTGTLLRVKEARKVFYVSMDDGAEFPIEAGLGVQLQGGDFFKKLLVTNRNAEPLEVEIWVGNNNVIDSRLNTRFDRDNPVFMKESNTDVIGSDNTVLPAGQVTVPARSTVGLQRKQIVISNVGASPALALARRN